MKSIELKFPPVVWVLGCAICMWACQIWLPGFTFELPHASTLVFLGVYVAAITEFQIRPEEYAMAQLFGERYAQYQREVPRWLGF